MIQLKKETIYISLLIIVISSIAYARFGITGIRTILGIILIFILPVYLILDYFALPNDEKLFFSLFTGLGIIPLIIWLMNIAIYSLRASIIIIFLILLTIGILLKLKKIKMERSNS